jgi:truncated hemoglobin YjbI
MTSHAEASAEGMCSATTKQGARCKKPAVERGLCVFHSGRLDLAELGRKGGQARAKKAEPQDRGERIRELAWQRLEQMLADPNVAPTAAVRALTEALDRLEPLLSRDEADTRKRIAAEYEAVTVSARAKLDGLISREVQRRTEARRITPAEFEEWLKGAGQALAELERVIVSDTDNPHEPIVRAAEALVDPEQLLRGLVEMRVIVPPADWKEFPEQLEARARELSAEAERRATDAERRAAEAEARLAEFELKQT